MTPNLGAGSTGATTTNPGTNPSGSGGSTTTIDTSGTVKVGQPRCEDPTKPETCSCVNIASVGKVAKYGTNTDSTDAFMAWLDQKSTAGTVAQLTTRAQATLTSTLLDQYDILVLQHLTDDPKQPAWVFTQEEIDAVKSWVTDKGGALFVMSGYESSNKYEIAPTNQLLAFTGIQVNGDDIAGGGTAALGRCQTADICSSAIYGCCTCWWGPQPIKAWDVSHPIAAGVTAEPYFRGRTITAPSDAQVVGTYTDGQTVKVGVGKQVGNGRVFVWGDEWITYTSQWQATTVNGNSDKVASNACYDAAAGQLRSPSYMFQVGRFWYNAIRWLQPAMTCFTITDVIL